MEPKSVVVIPARFGSTRFPGKVLALLKGKPVVQWVYESACQAGADQVIVATDEQKVIDAVAGFGGQAVMTSPDHPSGTDRVWEAVQGSDADIIINVQGDEPFIPHDVIRQLIDILKCDDSIEMATVAVPGARSELENNPNIVKVVFDNRNFALYFSRSMVPFLREGGNDTKAYHHWGIYAFKRDALKRFVSLPEGKFEQCEKLEQLRALENGINIYVLESDYQVVGIDTPEDLVVAEQKLSEC